MEPNLWLSLEETNSYRLSYWSTILGTNSLGAGPAAAMVDVLWSGGKGILYNIVQKKVHSRHYFQRGTATSHFRLCTWLIDLCCSQKADLSKSLTYVVGVLIFTDIVSLQWRSSKNGHISVCVLVKLLNLEVVHGSWNCDGTEREMAWNCFTSCDPISRDHVWNMKDSVVRI